MQTPIRHRGGSHDRRRRTAGPEGPRSRRFSSAAAVVADIALAVLAAALIVFLGDLALDLIVAILVLVAAVAAVATRPVQAFRGRAELDLLRQPLRPDLRPHLLQLLNYALLAALILIAGALATFTNLPLYASILLPASDRISGRQATVAVQLAALALVALALVPARRVRPVRNLAVLSFSVFLAVSLAPAFASPRAAVAVDLPLEGEWAMISGGRSTLLTHHYASPHVRYALDFARLVDGEAFVGKNPEHHASWHGFGQPVLAAADGTVVSVRDDLGEQPVGALGQGEGNAIVLDIGGGRYAVFAHLQQGSTLVRAGQSVTRGQRIAAVGNTGGTLSPHLHVQIQDRPSLAGDDREVRTFPMVFVHSTLIRGGRESTPPTADLRRGDVIRANR
jgi:hypothetical protein